jgi:hypothetical protein
VLAVQRESKPQFQPSTLPPSLVRRDEHEQAGAVLSFIIERPQEAFISRVDSAQDFLALQILPAKSSSDSCVNTP